MSLKEWERENIDILTSKQMGEWLARRENMLIEKIKKEIIKTQDKCNHPLEIIQAIDVIDKYKAGK